MVPQITPGSDTSFFRRAGDLLAAIKAQSVLSSSNQIVHSALQMLQRFRRFLGGQMAGIRARRAILALVFILSFSLPIAIVAHKSGFFAWHLASLPSDDRDAIFPESIYFSSPTSQVKIAPTDDLVISAERDLIIYSWVKFRRTLEPGQRMTILSSLENVPYPKAGFALTVTGESSGARPAVYWSSSEYAGWYRFTEFQLDPDSWYLFAISVRQGRALGLHVAKFIEEGRSDIQLLGGYDISQAGSPVSPRASLVIAPVGEGKFIGRVAVVGVSSVQDLSGKLKDLLKDLSRHPSENLDRFSSEELLLFWGGGERDLSPRARRVTMELRGKNKRGANVARDQE